MPQAQQTARPGGYVRTWLTREEREQGCRRLARLLSVVKHSDTGQWYCHVRFEVPVCILNGTPVYIAARHFRQCQFLTYEPTP